MKQIRCVASDLDGTFLNVKGEVGELSKEVLQQLHEKGILFVPCTGRAYIEAPDYFKERTEFKYLVTSNGALISDHAGNVIRTLVLSMEKAKEVFDVCAPISSYWTIDVDGTLYCSETLSDDKELIGETHKRIQEFRKTRIFQYDADFLNQAQGGVRKLHFMVKNAEHKAELLEALKDVKDILITWSGASNVEVQHPRCSKGEALKIVMNLEQISKEETVGFGDNTNDLSLFEAVGLKVAVENASEDLKKQADEIAQSNRVEGAALFVKDQLLCD